ncbi:MAG: hypothetical protein HQM03_10505 [Magnetococcales bacterium]|nr:hypothetical protein [Magnetococcales bacterium]
MAGKRIWCAVSGHGFGHFSQVAPILNRLATSIPDLEIHVTGGVPQAVIARMLVRPFTHDPHNRDVGLVQSDPLEVDRRATAEAVSRLHRDWPERVAAEARRMAAWSPDLVLADIPYLSLAAARAAGVASVAIASLTWDEVLAAYLPDHPELEEWLALMRDAYAATSLALLVTPALPTHPFPKSEVIPAITTPGVPRRERMRQVHGIADDRPVILVSLGGIPARFLPVDALVRDTRFHWLVDVPCPAEHDHMHPLRILPDLPFHDLAASVDGIVSKPGYGMAIAATASQVPFVYVRRGVFPDEPPICSWIERHGRAMELDGDAWRRGAFGAALERLMRLPPKPASDVRGAEVAARICLDRFLS